MTTQGAGGDAVKLQVNPRITPTVTVHWGQTASLISVRATDVPRIGHLTALRAGKKVFLLLSYFIRQVRFSQKHWEKRKTPQCFQFKLSVLSFLNSLLKDGLSCNLSWCCHTPGT